MSYPIDSLSAAVSKLQEYIATERPMNLQEMAYLLAVLDPATKAAKNIVMNVKPDSIPGWLINDFITLKQKT